MNLAELNSYHARDFACWLDNSLRQQYHNDPEVRYRALDFRHLGVARGESRIDDLAKLFNKLSSPAQEAMRQGLGLLFRVVKVGDFPEQAMRDLILLALTLSSPATLDAFIPVVGEGEWGKAYPNLIYDCAGVMISLNRTDEAEKLQSLLRQYSATSSNT